MVNSKTKIESEGNNFFSVSKDIASILGIDKSELKIEEHKKGLSNMIDDILKKYSKHKKLAKYLISELDAKYFTKLDTNLRGDKDIVIVAIRASSDNFMYIDDKLKKDEFVAYEVIKSFIREGKNFFEVNTFINKNYLILKQDLLKFYKNELKKFDIVSSDDLTKNLINLGENEADFFNLLKTKKIIIGKGKKLEVNPDFINNLEKYFQKNTDYKNADLVGKRQLKFNYLVQILGLSGVYISNKSTFILNSIIDLSNIESDKNNLEREIKNKNDDFNDKEDKDYKKTKKGNDSSDDDIFSNRLDNCLPNCTYTFSGSGYYNIETSGNIYVKISEEEKNNFTSVALKNFIKFYSKLHKLGLSFLWDKYKTKFITLTNNKFGLDYLNGEGITEGKTLSVFNIIGKNIGVPEKEIIGDDGKPQKEVKCFKTLGEAELKFENIKSSSMINGEYIETGMGTGIVEKKLHLEGKIDITKGEFFMNSW